MAKEVFQRTKPHLNIGTIGHIDHGKTTLTAAITMRMAVKQGTKAKKFDEIDNAPEEKERGMTIDLGFAWLKLPGGREIGIVDVPGHERFVKNMLAGVGGMSLMQRTEKALSLNLYSL